jgi:hypothetical protein
MKRRPITRRDFLKMSALWVGGLTLSPWRRLFTLPEYPGADRLGRVISGMATIKARPDIDSEDVGVLYDDDVVPWIREVVGSRPLWYNQRFVGITQPSSTFTVGEEYQIAQVILQPDHVRG